MHRKIFNFPAAAKALAGKQFSPNQSSQSSDATGQAIFNCERGATAILMSFFVMMIIVLISLAVANIMIFEIKMSREIANSIPAFYAADAGTEQCLFQIRNSDSGEPCDSISGTINGNLVGNGASFIVTRTAASTTQSIGTFSATNRKIETDWP